MHRLCSTEVEEGIEKREGGYDEVSKINRKKARTEKTENHERWTAGMCILPTGGVSLPRIFPGLPQGVSGWRSHEHHIDATFHANREGAAVSPLLHKVCRSRSYE
ncbi:hypothetical protein E2C01_077622 [Portunus trituberculatus]|uniref:Uncharacterized protein n=1 Tax=Portunus trituberculatus TaxID=210409 RepID=A0A5B7IKP2_PORTR|nr:hypothetical protein [Portunus trituberculatus]